MQIVSTGGSGPRRSPIGRSPGVGWLAALLVVLLTVAGGLAAPVSAAAPDSDGDQLTDAFEIHYGITDAQKKDTDGDGVRDPAEDPDHDGLSNLGEQRFGTDPTKADTDGDGTRDSAEDENGNGIKDAKEQDRRPVPRHLVPSLADAADDTPISYRDGCHTAPTSPVIHPCAYADLGSSTTLVLFGDSHAGEWVPAAIKTANAHHWRVVVLTKSGCPSVDVRIADGRFPGLAASCHTWRDRATAWLRAHPPSVIVLTNLRIYKLLDDQGQRIPRADREAAWQHGLTRTLDRLPDSSQHVVLADTPFQSHIVPNCLAENLQRISTCETTRAKGIRPEHDQAEKAAAEADGGVFADLDMKVCPYDPCPVVVNELLIWRDQSHITATYSKQLAPSFGAMVADALSSAARAYTRG